MPGQNGSGDSACSAGVSPAAATAIMSRKPTRRRTAMLGEHRSQAISYGTLRGSAELVLGIAKYDLSLAMMPEPIVHFAFSNFSHWPDRSTPAPCTSTRYCSFSDFPAGKM